MEIKKNGMRIRTTKRRKKSHLLQIYIQDEFGSGVKRKKAEAKNSKEQTYIHVSQLPKKIATKIKCPTKIEM